MRETNNPKWKVPYLPIDPEDVGRNYEAVIRINSQSGKGGVAYIIEKDHGLSLPRRLQIDFSGIIQKIADESGKELEANLIWDTFKTTYLDVQGKYEYLSHEIISRNDDKNNQVDEINLILNINNKTSNLSGKGNGPIDSFINALEKEIGFANDRDDMLVVNQTEDETRYGLKYERLVPMLVNAIKELSETNKDLKSRIEALESN